MSIAGMTGGAGVQMKDLVANTTKNPAVKTEKVETKNTPELSTEQYVRKYFSDIPVLAEVAKCESRFRQEDKNGNVLRGEQNEFDMGVMQINEQYHGDRSEELGLDISTIAGNVSYARYLFENEGLRPWKSSSACWKKSQAYADYVSTPTKASNKEVVAIR